MDEYRVFISYAHKDRELVDEIVTVLKENGLIPMWDKNLSFGTGFHEQIQAFIAHAHVFMPIITSASGKRGWVHQEIGYAMALNIPVLPVTRDTLPGEMIQTLHAIQLSEDMSRVREQLSMKVFENLINRYRDISYALFQCAELAEDRAMMMAGYAEKVSSLDMYGCVRQKGALSSFHIPDKVITDPVWKERYAPFTRSDHHCRCQRNERLALEKHARENGCRLIIDPYMIKGKHSAAAQLVRIRSLIEFLESMPDDKVQIVVSKDTKESLTIVGDWFMAESVSVTVTQGYRQTIFTRHAPSIQNRIDLFDHELQELLQKSGWSAHSSRIEAMNALSGIITELEASLTNDHTVVN